MSWITKTLTSSIGKKILMSLTGLFLCLFLVIHLIGNFQLFNQDGGYSFNQYAVFMTTFPLIKAVSYFNYFFILFHAFWGIYLTYQNKKAKGSSYAVNKNASTFASRNMAILGTILLIYIAVHMANFWYTYHNGHVPYVAYTENLTTGEVSTVNQAADYTQASKMVTTYNEAAGTKTTIVKDLYEIVSESFKNIALVLFYVLSMAVLGFHLYHGFQSAFQTLGINHPKYSPIIKGIGMAVFGFLIPIGFAIMPLYFYFFN